MGLSFFETMQGALVDDDATAHPIRFEVKGEATEIAGFLRRGQLKITGIVDGLPFADQAALEGTMEISPLRKKKISYDFQFRDPQGVPSRFRGHKDLRLLRPLASMTQLTGAIHQQGREIASGELYFNLTDLPEFATSWWPSTTIPRADMHAPLGDFDAHSALSEREIKILSALVEATFCEGDNVPAPDAHTTEEAARQIQALPSHAYQLHRWALHLLERATLITDRRHYSALPLSRRRQLLERLTDPQRADHGGFELPTVRLLVQLLTTFVKMAHFGRRDYLDAIGHPRPRQIAQEEQERYMRRVIPPEALENSTDIEAHVAVIGTGAGGAAVAYQLAKQGLAVAMIEEGRYFKRHDFSGPPLDRMRATYRHRATNFTVGTPIVIPQGRTVGGTTTINSGTCFATPDEVLNQWREELDFPDDFAPEHYHRYSDQVAAMLQVEPGRRDALGTIADIIARGADQMGLDHGPLPRNAPGCTGAGECILGCPEGAKRSTDVSYVPAALRAGAELYVGLPATRILMDDSRAVAVETRGTDRHGRPRRLRVFADRIVVACGAVHSPVFLRENGFRHPWIGDNLSVHPGIGILARMDQSLQPWNTIPQGYAIEALEERGIRFEGYYLHPQLTAPMLPWVGSQLNDWMDDFARLAQFGFMIRDRGVGKVRRGPNGMPILTYSLSPRSIDRIKAATSLLARLFLKAGAREVFTGFGPDPVVRTLTEARSITTVDVGPLDFRLLGAHPLGTCRMAASRDDGVVDFDHRLFGTDNLHVVDGSTVPTSLGVNPQMTIMAMALRAGDRIANLI